MHFVGSQNRLYNIKARQKYYPLRIRLAENRALNNKVKELNLISCKVSYTVQYSKPNIEHDNVHIGLPSFCLTLKREPIPYCI